jgi:thiamine biosynthesis lipoprotein
MYRREFIHLRQLAQAAGQIPGPFSWLPAISDESESDSDVALIRLARRCMATTFEVVLPYGTPRAVEIGQAAFAQLDTLEAQLTVYRDMSDVCHLNRIAPYQPVVVEEGLFGLLQLAESISARTQGAFDITAGTLIKAWGFFRGPRGVPVEADRLRALEHTGMHHVELDAEKGSVRFHRPGLELNLGSIGKGYAIDRVAASLRADRGLSTVLLQGGSSSVYAGGCPTSDRRGWAVDLRHPWQPGQHLGRFWLRDRGLGTSAATFQYIEHDGRKLGHVLDPRTGWPASGIASASVVAPTAAEADALSTAFFVGGVELARAVCSDRPEIGAVLLPEGDNAETVVLNLSRATYSLPAAARACANQ